MYPDAELILISKHASNINYYCSMGLTSIEFELSDLSVTHIKPDLWEYPGRSIYVYLALVASQKEKKISKQ